MEEVDCGPKGMGLVFDLERSRTVMWQVGGVVQARSELGESKARVAERVKASGAVRRRELMANGERERERWGRPSNV